MDKMHQDFILYLEDEIHNYTDVPFLEELRSLIKYFIQSGLFSESSMRHYTIRKTYDVQIQNEIVISKSKCVQKIAAKYCLHENTVWNALKNYTGSQV